MNRLRRVDDDSSDDEGAVGAHDVKSNQSMVDDVAEDSDSGRGDSSEESSDDDAEEMAKVRVGFIVDSDGDEDISDGGEKRKRRKRRRRPRTEEDIELDEDDLDLLGLAGAAGRADSAAESNRFKRLKKASSADQSNKRRGLDAIFDDAEEEEAGSDDEQPSNLRNSSRGLTEEFDDFIEADEFSDDDDEELRRQEEREVGHRRRTHTASADVGALSSGLSAAVGDLAGLDEEKMSEIFDIFGNGEEYDWALVNEDEEVDSAAHPPQDEELQLTDVFEPSELAARMLTAEDNAIRSEDVPERFQVLRQKLKQHPYDLDDEQYGEKKQWITNKVVAYKRVEPELLEETRDAVSHALTCISRESLEVPFVWHHRQDYLVHFSSKASDATKTQLLTLDDLWHIVDLDLDFHAIIERRNAAKALAEQVFTTTTPENTELKHAYDKYMAAAHSGIEFQDVVDFLQFEASAQLRAARRHSRFAQFDRVRQSTNMEIVNALNMAPARVAPELPSDEDMLNWGKLTFQDMALTPQELASELGATACVELAVSFAAHALGFDPRVRHFFRTAFEQHCRVDLVITDDGRRKITPNSPFADLKYSCNWRLDELRSRPALFLRMLRAESQGLLIVRAQYPHYKTTLYGQFEELVAGGSSPEWHASRSAVAKAASRLIVPAVARSVLESLRADCVRSLRYDVRSAFAAKLDQAPFKPHGYVLGTVPRVLCITAGEANAMDAVLACIVDEDGHVSDIIKLGDSRNTGFVDKLVETVKDVRPDVVGVAGFTPAARRLKQTVTTALVEKAQLMAGPEDSQQPLEVVWVQDEVARMYRHSDRAAQEFPDLAPNARYCVAAARYLQSPLLEYAQLDAEQLRNVVLYPGQELLPAEEFAYATESAFVDSVCLVGVDINLAIRSQYHASLLQYVAGLGPRKASGIVQAVLARTRGGRIALRTQLVTAEITPRIVFMNCASFLRISWRTADATSSRQSETSGDYLDATRVHPEDYELARKMCADALDLDEEDIEVVEEHTAGGVVGKLISDDAEARKLDELVLEDYADELQQLFKQKKRVTLNTIHREIQDPYGEMRRRLRLLSPDDIFTMLTGETRKTIHTGSVVSATVRRVTGRQLMLSLGSGIDAIAESGYISDDRSVPIQQQFAPGQAVQAAIESVDYAALLAMVNTKQSSVTAALERLQHMQQAEGGRGDVEHWNTNAELRDTEAVQRREASRDRQMRVIKHPLFRPFGAREAEAFLAPLQRGDVVIRPSSRGNDHLVVTWKVADQIYQHIDVHELEKLNDYALGRKLVVGGKFVYSDLDDLIINHVQLMARKVDEMASSDKFQQGNRRDVEKWLSAYTNARPMQSVYAFCFDHRRPGYFLLSYMLGANQPIRDCHVKVVPRGFELMNSMYPDVQGVTNGFKTMVQRARV